uniref:Uncharacterized protein LOC111138215 isoform X2 n=1 Tax=Crassostrea virginica TaxID=6565 RepID=A0A8B8F0S9_CRAVI|nr:uncharacterized protein LOC111138215 isoform X2 [Crassostrea virginica]
MIGNTDACPVTKEAWEKRAAERETECGGESVYHCLSDNEGRKWERCVLQSLIKEGNCPIFTSSGYIDWKTCNLSDPTCPNISYKSDQVYKYSVCFGNNTPSEKTDVFDEDENPPLVLITAVIVFILLAAILASVIIYRRWTRKSQRSEEDGEELARFIPVGLSDEVVRQDHVLNGITALEREDVRSITVLGKFGISVSSTSRLILQNYAKRMQWISHQCRFTDIPDKVEENTIIFVYGWFGFLNDDLCSTVGVQTACQKLEQHLKTTQSLKIIVGMRSDLSKKYHKELEEHTDLFHTEINLDSENVHKDAQYSKYFKEKIIDPCEDSKCECKDLTFHMLRKGKDKHVGMPLKINVIARYHDIVPNYIKDWDILKALSDHITALGENKNLKYVSEWIKYICLKGKFSRSDQFDEKLVKDVGLEIEKDTFDENDVDIRKYIRMRYSDQQNNVSGEEAQYVFWHPFIYICAFHSLYQKDKDLIMRHCNVDAILQLVRPRGFKTSYIEVSADDHGVNMFNNRLRENNLVEKYKGHPLVKTVIPTLVDTVLMCDEKC